MLYINRDKNYIIHVLVTLTWLEIHAASGVVPGGNACLDLYCRKCCGKVIIVKEKI